MKYGKKRVQPPKTTTATEPQSVTTGKRYSFLLAYELSNCQTNFLSESEEFSDLAKQIDSWVTVPIYDMRESGNSAKGWMIVRVESDFAGRTFPNPLIASAIIGLPKAVKAVFVERSPQEWRPSTDDLGYIRIVIYLKSTSDILKSLELKGGGISTEQMQASDNPESIQEGTDKRPEYLAALLATVPKDVDYAKKAREYEVLRHDFHQKFAADYQDLLKAAMASKNHATYDDKKELVKWVNAELRRFDLSIKSPKTGLAAALRAKPGNHPEFGSFELSSEDADGKEKTFTTPELSALIDKVVLMEAPPRRESIMEWQEKVSKPRGGAKRP